LPVRHTRGEELLVDYSQSHVVTCVEYLNIQRKEIMDIAIAKEIKKGKRKERKDKRTKGVVDLRTTTNKTTIKIAKKHVKAKFIITWTPTTIKEVNDNFH
jgi:hypothetical protein